MLMRRMLDKVKFLYRTGFLYIFGSSTINKMVSFAYGIFIVRVISKTDYGVFTHANNIFSMLILLSGLGISSAVIQLGSEYSGDEQKQLDLFAYSYRFGLIFNAFLSLLILTIGLLIPLPIEGSNKLLIFMAFLPILAIIKELQIIWLRVKLQNKAFSLANTVNAFLTSALSILGAWLLASKGIVFGQYLVSLSMIMLLNKYFGVPFIKNGHPLLQQQKTDLFRIAGISTLNNTLSQLLSLLGSFMLGLIIMDENVIASYKVATTIPFALSFIPGSLMIYVYPHFAKNRSNRAWVKRNYRLIMLAAGITNLFIALMGIIFAEAIIRVVFPLQYLDAVPPFRILMLSYFFSGTFRTISGNLLVTQRKLKSNLISGIIGSVATIAFNLWLIPRFGSMGAAYSHALSMLITGMFATLMMTFAIRQI